jgi:predicted metal-binding membrane protein
VGSRIAAPQSAPTASVAVLTVAAGAWLAVVAIAESPWTSYLSSATPDWIRAHPWSMGAVAGCWLLMVLAMMLPTTLVLVSTFDRVIAPHDQGSALQLLMLGGYVSVWVVAGLALNFVALGSRALVGGGSILVVAGTYQLASGRFHCPECCRAPPTAIRQRWTQASPWASSARVGIVHGLDCVGCSWALMVVMLSRGGGCSLLWMEALSAVMLAEKLTPLGYRAREAAGAALVSGGLLVALTT